MNKFGLIFFIILFSLLGCKPKDPESKSGENGDNSSTGKGKIIISVGVTDTCQQPITFEDGEGLSKDIVDELNAMQDDFQFTHEVIPTKRLEEMVKSGKIDIAAFHNLAWGWTEESVEKSIDLINAKDVYVALKKDQRDEKFFEDLDNRSKIGVMGFHYSFIESDLTPEQLKSQFNLDTVHSEKAVVDMVISERCEVGIVSTLTLQYLMKKSPEKHTKLLISEKYDTKYDRYYVLKKGISIKKDQFDSLLLKLHESGKLKELFKKYGLDDPAIARN